MPILTSLILLLAGLALLVVLARVRPQARVRRLENWEESKMELGAKICEAAARDAFEIELDHSEASIAELDRLIDSGWTGPDSRATVSEGEFIAHDGNSVALDTPSATRAVKTDDAVFVIASYFGAVFVSHLEAEWRLDTKTHRWPHLYFKASDLAASPFDIVSRKFENPAGFSLRDVATRLRQEVERRKNDRSLSWHPSGAADSSESTDTASATFTATDHAAPRDEPEQHTLPEEDDRTPH